MLARETLLCTGRVTCSLGLSQPMLLLMERGPAIVYVSSIGGLLCVWDLKEACVDNLQLSLGMFTG